MASAEINLRCLRELLDMEELKKDTSITKNILMTTTNLLSTEDGVKTTNFTELLKSPRQSFTDMIKSVKGYKLLSTKREKLWILFHKFSITEGIQICERYDKAMNLNPHEIFWQLLMEKVFLNHVVESFSSTSNADGAAVCCERKLTDVEENAIRYTAGAVIRKLEKKYTQLKTQSAQQCVTALKEMGGKLSTRTHISKHPSQDYTNLADRGGLYHIEDRVYSLFVVIETIVHKELSVLFDNKGAHIEKVKKDNLSWVCNDEEVQLMWQFISPTTIEEKGVRQRLLAEIAHLWITTRGYSMASSAKESLKKRKSECIKGKKSLRKDLATK